MEPRTPRDPSSCISLARLTNPYAPLPISRSITNSEMLRSPTVGALSTPGVGGPALLATLKKLAALPDRTSFCGPIGGGDGGSAGIIETRPAMRETRCCEERRRDRGVPGIRGEEGDLRSGERPETKEFAGDNGRGEEHRDCTGEREMKLPDA